MRPLMMVPTTRPRWAGSAIVAANGTRIWAMTEVNPTSATAGMNTPTDGEKAAAASPTAVMAASAVMSRRRSSRSPSGIMRMRPAA